MERIDGPTLACLLAIPPGPAQGPRPVLCFLHGYDEGPPVALEEGIARHGPLERGVLPVLAGRFLVVTPQLPVRGDLWHLHAEEVRAIVREVQRARGGDPARTYITGFSYGGNGVFDLALAAPGFWAALWPVDPTRAPLSDPGAPVWLSVGAAARRARESFIRALRLQPAEDPPAGDRLWLDEGEDHVGSARRAYRDGRIYDWMLTRRLD